MVMSQTQSGVPLCICEISGQTRVQGWHQVHHGEGAGLVQGHDGQGSGAGSSATGGGDEGV